MRMWTAVGREGALGFDMNQRITPALAKVFVEHGYTFAVRYVRRAQQHDYDLTFEEVSDILRSGLGLMIVQHVAPPGWLPTQDLGSLQGAIAAREIEKLQIPTSTMVWCDLEEVSPSVPPAHVASYCNAWFDAVHKVGTPGLYVGYRAGLSPTPLYKSLKFSHYWAAYNLNLDEYPAHRGICLKQRVAKPSETPSGVIQDGFDVDVVLKDSLGGLPTILYGQD